LPCFHFRPINVMV